jgi:hypothetical protein
MRRPHPVRRFSLVVLVSAASMAGLTASGPAGAAGGIVTCGEVGGHQGSFSTLFSCLPSDSTGGSGTIATPMFSGRKTGTIDWDPPSQSTHPTTVIRVTTHVLKKKKTSCPSGTSELKVSGSVRSDTSGSATVGGPVSGILCQSANGGYALLTGTVFSVG